MSDFDPDTLASDSGFKVSISGMVRNAKRLFRGGDRRGGEHYLDEMGDYLRQMNQIIHDYEATLGKLPLTADGVRVVPPDDEVWIDPTEPGGWPSPDMYFADDAPPIKAETWAYYGDHIWLDDGSMNDGSHWFGKIYSTEAACLAARKDTP